MTSPCFPLRLNLVPDQRRHIGPTKIFDCANSSRRSDIDFGQIAVDHVNSDEQQTTLAQRRADTLADLNLAFCELGCRRLATSHQDRKSTRLNSSHLGISYAVFCLKK